jgi:hypothetical protein
LRIVSVAGPTVVGTFVDFNQGRTRTELEYAAYGLIASIASIKDHLKQWCANSGRPFSGDRLIDTNIDVALVHDLWNTDKHAALDKPPRSGVRPSLRELGQVMELATGPTAGSVAAFTIDPRTGRPQARTSDGGSVALVVEAQIVDEHGAVVGSLQAVCRRAIAAWEQAAADAGVQLT